MITTGFQSGHRLTEREYTVEHLEPGHAYRVRVCCFSIGGQSDVSSVIMPLIKSFAICDGYGSFI